MDGGDEEIQQSVRKLQGRTVAAMEPSDGAETRLEDQDALAAAEGLTTAREPTVEEYIRKYFAPGMAEDERQLRKQIELFMKEFQDRKEVFLKQELRRTAGGETPSTHRSRSPHRIAWPRHRRRSPQLTRLRLNCAQWDALQAIETLIAARPQTLQELMHFADVGTVPAHPGQWANIFEVAQVLANWHHRRHE